MGEYEVHIDEVADGLFIGTVFHVEGERRENIGTTEPSGMRPNVEEGAKSIASRHKNGPEIVKLDV
jgi:hypothetical protein